MSNAVVQFQPHAQTVPNFTMSDMERVALAIAKGGLFGSGDPNAVLTLCMLAQAEGQHPAVVFRDYHIINGKPAKKSEAMQRDFLMAGGKIEWHRLEDECVDATFSHPQGGTVRISWDNARVAQAQLGSNPMHKKYPRQMKKARVIAEGVRTVWPSATSGLYEPGEVQGMSDETATTPPMPAAKRARDLKAEAPAIELHAEPVDDPRAKAEAWVKTHTEAVADCADMAALDAVIATGRGAVAKLDRDHKDLREAVMDAYSAKGEALEAAIANATPGNEPADDMGDGFADEGDGA